MRSHHIPKSVYGGFPRRQTDPDDPVGLIAGVSPHGVQDLDVGWLKTAAALNRLTCLERTQHELIEQILTAVHYSKSESGIEMMQKELVRAQELHSCYKDALCRVRAMRAQEMHR